MQERNKFVNQGHGVKSKYKESFATSVQTAITEVSKNKDCRAQWLKVDIATHVSELKQAPIAVPSSKKRKSHQEPPKLKTVQTTLRPNPHLGTQRSSAVSTNMIWTSAEVRKESKANVHVYL